MPAVLCILMNLQDDVEALPAYQGLWERQSEVIRCWKLHVIGVEEGFTLICHGKPGWMTI